MRTLVFGVFALATGGSAMPSTLTMQPDPCTVVRQFNEAMNRRDLAGVGTLLTDDFVFENTNPPPDGARVEGHEAYLQWLERWFAANADASFETEEQFGAEGRCIVRWVYRKTRGGRPWHLRGVDVITVTGGRLSAKRSYVKG